MTPCQPQKGQFILNATIDFQVEKDGFVILIHR